MRLALDPEHAPFAVEEQAGKAYDIEINVRWAENLEVPAEAPAFDSGGLWTAYPTKNRQNFYFATESLGKAPYKAAWFDPDFRRGEIFLNRQCLTGADVIYPLEYPVDELLITHRLAKSEGVEVHALGLVDRDGSGYLFLGHSGAGKSTTARLWKQESSVELLSDDRIILRKQDGEFWMYGTPWHGDAGIASPGRAKVHAMFVLEKAPRNEIVAMKPSQGVAELFARCFAPQYLALGLQFTLEFLEEFERRVPCSTFRFLPNFSAVEAIRRGRA